MKQILYLFIGMIAFNIGIMLDREGLIPFTSLELVMMVYIGIIAFAVIILSYVGISIVLDKRQDKKNEM